MVFCHGVWEGVMGGGGWMSRGWAGVVWCRSLWLLLLLCEVGRKGLRMAYLRVQNTGVLGIIGEALSNGVP